WVAQLKSTAQYATLSIINTILHTIIKGAEGLMVGAIIMCGQYCGARQLRAVGHTFTTAFWSMLAIGVCASAVLFFAPYFLLYYSNLSPAMLAYGVPFVRVRALGILLMFAYFAFIAFLRGVKNTRTPMVAFVVGGLVFIFFDYALIFGACGLPCLGLQGSAWATVLQYSTMLLLVAVTVFRQPIYRQYGLTLFGYRPKWAEVRHFLALGWPAVVDKLAMALAYWWLGRLILDMGQELGASFGLIKDFERAVFLPAIAFAQVITFLASNDIGAKNIIGIKANIKKIMLLAHIFVFIILALMIYYQDFLIHLFDPQGNFTEITKQAFPIISFLVFFDVLQILLSGALRGVSDVQVVMWTRVAVCIVFFFPVSYAISKLPWGDNVLKFILIYSVFYLSNGLMSLVYVQRFRSGKWLKQTEFYQ
ncbi:MAG TPA: MATE family efflux transporter, partial [Candidatus Babeliales bacterium]|nr:MATE family efflux transporter [Candidatus Babeliales bacterium]